MAEVDIAEIERVARRVSSNIGIVMKLREAMVSGHIQHGRLTRDPVRANVILMEEIGEVARAALEATRPTYYQYSDALKLELYQAAATIFWWLANLEDAYDV